VLAVEDVDDIVDPLREGLEREGFDVAAERDVAPLVAHGPEDAAQPLSRLAK